MGLNLDLVGKPTDPLEHQYSWRDVVIYALGVGARMPDELAFLFEQSGPRVLPTFAVVPSFKALIDIVGRLGANLAMLVHGEQKVTLHRPVPASGTFVTRAEVTGIYDKGKGALVVVEANTTDQAGEAVFDNRFSLFIRGAGGFGGERGPEAVRAEPPAGVAPDFEHEQTTTTEQAALYRLSGDLNPLHISPDVASLAGFERPILHGLCTYGHAGRAVLHHACGSDPARFRSLSARFTGVVYPGDTITTRGWQIEPGKYVVQAKTQDDRLVLSNSIAEVVAK